QIKGRQKYVLGWDNTDKIAILREEARTIDKEIKEIENRRKYIENQQSRVRRTEKNLERFIDFQKYRKIDWWSVTAKIQGNTQKIEELRKTNDRVYTLKKQRDEILSQIRSKKEIV